MKATVTIIASAIFGLSLFIGSLAHGQDIKIDEYPLSGEYFSCSSDKNGNIQHCGIYIARGTSKTDAIRRVMARNKGYAVVSASVELKSDQRISGPIGSDMHSTWLVVVLKKELKK